MPPVATARAVVAVVACSLFAPTVAAAQGPPSFAQLSGTDGCLIAAGTDGSCDTARGLFNPSAIALSPDDRHVYVASWWQSTRWMLDGSVVTLARSADTGALSFVGCVTDSGDDGRVGTEGGCADGDALLGASGVVVSPDGRFVYVTSARSDAVAWFARDAATGALTQRGCLKASPFGDHCRAAYGLHAATSPVIAPDGRHVYVVSPRSSSITAFVRDEATGSLSPAGCISDSGQDGRCVNGTGLRGVFELTVAPDGRSMYAVSQQGAVTQFGRDPETGALAQQACLLDAGGFTGSCTSAPTLGSPAHAVVTPGGEQLLVAGASDNTLTVFGRAPLARLACYLQADPEGDDREHVDEEEPDEGRSAQAVTCGPAKALWGVAGIAVSGDGRAVFTTGNGYFAAFRRDPDTGALEQFGCLESNQQYRSCAELRGTNAYGPTSLVTTADGRNVYMAGYGGIAVLGASAAVVSRSARASRAGRIQVRLACPAARDRGCRGRLTIGSRATRPYRVASGKAARVGMTLPPAVRGALRARGRASIAIIAHERHVGAATRRLVVTARW